MPPPHAFLQFGFDVSFYLTLLIIAVGIVLFVKEYFTIDVTAILIMVLFIVTGVLSPEEGFAGFTNPATITVACMFVLSFALFRSGVLDPLIRALLRLARWNRFLAVVTLMVFAALVSAFINDTAVVALLIPATLRIAERTGLPASKLLMPLSFSALLGGVCTLVGTSTNILVSSIAEKQGYAPLGMFEFSAAAFWMALAGLAYLLTIGFWLLPGRRADDLTSTPTAAYVSRIRLDPGARDIGRKLSASQLHREYQAQVIDIHHRLHNPAGPIAPDLVLREGDELTVVLGRDRLRELRRQPGIKVLTEYGEPVPSGTLRLFEVVVPKGSRLAGHSASSWTLLKELERGIIGLRRNERVVQGDPVTLPVAEGDILLLANTRRTMYRLLSEDVLTIIDEFEIKRVDLRKAGIAILVLAGVVGGASLGLAPIVLTVIIGVLALLLGRVITPEEAYGSVEWKVIFLLAGVLSMGAALQKTGGDLIIANGLVHLAGDGHPLIALAAVFGITFLSTNVMSNNATAALMTPIALQLAKAMQVSERPFIVAVMFAASLAFMTPMSYQTNSMIYGPGNYRFNDYLRVGTPLNLIIWIVAMVVIPIYFPF